jgi:Raf kinase inhibitor-like YbhB/YbcL family protein
MPFAIEVPGFPEGGPIPGTFAFCIPADVGHVAMAPNRNPLIRWAGAPGGTRSFVVLCVDSDAPTVPDTVNQEGMTVPAILARSEFSHWVLVDVPADVSEIGEGADSDGVTPHGKPLGPGPVGLRGRNDYTGWFAGDPDMEGVYAGYDGPCPPWNDELVHHYTFTVHALDIETVGLSGDFGLAEVRAAIDGHVLASASQVGTYSLNPEVEA